ncbi:MAG TPA: membrane protein insertase YidC, partial [Chitinophagaceae bacterium]|nr:membrane protein insertase YidC [Chitinophagaceae bacterium]
MNLDRNTIFGFIALAILFLGYFFYNSKDQQRILAERARRDSIDNAGRPKADPVTIKRDSVLIDSQNRVAAAGDYVQYTTGAERIIPIENEVAKYFFTNKGGQLKRVELKQFRGPDSSLVKLGATPFDKFSYVIKTSADRTADISGFYFTGGEVTRDAANNQTITFGVQSSNGTSMVHKYVIKPDNYMIDLDVQLNGLSQLTSNNTLNLTWQNQAVQLQKDLDYEKQQSQISYRADADYDYSGAMESGSEEFEKNVNWVAVKQQFFHSAIVAKNNFSSGRVDWTSPNTGNAITQATANFKYILPASVNATIPLSLYYGPTDYKVLKKYDNEMEDMVNLGSGMFAFVKYLNRWIVIPVFDFFRMLTSNYGIVILLLTLFIRLCISPLSYSSYLSGAKMKVLRPEIDKLKAKYGNDQQQISMEQMKLFREAGVNPMGGCIPGLLQIPIFFALYSFFNSNVALRGQGFLWAEDLSQYDSILNLPFKIPFYGDHVSLFTITAVVTSFLISLYSMSMTPDQNNPVLKYMPYFFPI